MAEISRLLGVLPTSDAKSCPKRSASGKNGLRVSLASLASMLTAKGTKSPASASCTMSAITSPALSCASRVLAPRCGVTTICGIENNGDSVIGSLVNTSSAAPAMRPSLTAVASASSSIMPPRATLITRSSGFAFKNISRPMMPMVSLFLGKCTVRKSDSATSWSSGIISIFN